MVTTELSINAKAKHTFKFDYTQAYFYVRKIHNLQII